jgi:vacuolar-type H+-ATPase subunit F/Vma7
MELETHPEAGDIVIVTAELTPELASYIDSLSAEGRVVTVVTVPKEEGAAAYA